MNTSAPQPGGPGAERIPGSAEHHARKDVARKAAIFATFSTLAMGVGTVFYMQKAEVGWNSSGKKKREFEEYQRLQAFEEEEMAALEAAMPRENPVVYVDVAVDSVPIGRMYLRLFVDTEPVAAEYFRRLFVARPSPTPEAAALPPVLVGTLFDRFVPGSLVQGGMLDPAKRVPLLPAAPEKTEAPAAIGEEQQNAEGGKPVEAKTRAFDAPYYIGLAGTAARPDPNNTRFFITTRALSSLTGTHAVLGRVEEGRALLHELERLKATESTDTASAVVTVSACGEVVPASRFKFVRDGLQWEQGVASEDDPK